MTAPINIDDQSFEERVIKASLPVVVDVWAPWCGPCRMVAPIVEELAEEYSGRLVFTKLNADENAQTVRRYLIRSIPTLLLFKGGEVVGQIVGFQPKAELKKQIEATLL